MKPVCAAKKVGDCSFIPLLLTSSFAAVIITETTRGNHLIIITDISVPQAQSPLCYNTHLNEDLGYYDFKNKLANFKHLKCNANKHAQKLINAN